MHWWQGAFTSSSKPPADNDAVIGRGDGEAGGTRNFIKTGLFSSRRNRNLQRARKLPDVAENDVELWRSPSHSSVGSFSSSPSTSASAAPQPLPMPELHLLLQRDPKFSKSSSGTVPLPSPQTRIQNPRRGLVEKLRGRGGDGDTIDELNADAIDGLNGLKSGFEGQDKKIHAERYGIRPSKKSPLKKNAKERSINSCSISIPNSAPTSPYSSPILSPRRSDTSQYMIPPDVLQVWSAPEMPHTDRHVGLGFYQVHARKSVSSVDSSPLQSPRLSNHARDTSPVMSVLPLNVKVSSETPLARREKETCAPSTVHPLPLPPLASALQPLPVSPLTSRSDISGTSTAKLEYSGSNIPIPHSPISPAPEIVPVKSQWQKGKLIGRGTFGSVYVASNRETGALCAMKEVEILPDDSKSAESLKQLQQEINVLSHLKHPNIVQYYGSEIVDDKFYIYLEYVHPGSINKFIHDHCGVMTESVVRNFTRHILSGLAYLHSKKTIHRDIKGANLLVDAYGVVKLADFGMAKHLNGQAANLSLKGSPYWLAPELLQSSVQTEASSDIALAVDIWSLGCTIIEMLNGKPPWSEYEGAAALFKVLQESPPIPETLSADGKDFLHRCFCRNPAERPTAAMLLEHPFVNNMHQHQHQHSDSCIHSLKEIRLSDHTQLIRGRSAHKYDQIPTMFDLQKKAKLGNNENIQRSHYQPNAPLAVVPFPSPRSTLDGLNAFSSPSLGHSPDSPSARPRNSLTVSALPMGLLGNMQPRELEPAVFALIIFIYIKIIYTHTHKNKKESTVLRESWKHREWSLHRFNPLTNPAPTTLHNCKKTSKIKWLMTVALASMTVRTAASTTCSVTSVNFEFLLVYIIISILLGYTYVFLGLNTFASSCYFLFK